jgi:intein/homing endonuclease
MITEEKYNSIIKAYKDGLTIGECVVATNISSWTVRKVLKETGTTRTISQSLLISKTRQKYPINQYFFDSIDNEEKAYWLGFIAADGSIRSPKKALEMGLSIKDEEHLYKLARALESSHPIRRYKNSTQNSAILSICNYHIIDSLRKLDIKNIVPQIPNSLYKHYYRGLIDGDGCLSISKLGYVIVNLVGILPVCDSFLTFVKEMGVKTPASVKDKGTYCTVSICGKENAKIICTELYKNSSVYLDRKYEKAKLLGEF